MLFSFIFIFDEYPRGTRGVPPARLGWPGLASCE